MENCLTDSVSVVHEKSNVQMTEVIIWCDTPWVRVEANDNSVSGDIGHVSAVETGMNWKFTGQKGMFHFIQIVSTVLKLREFINIVGKRTRVWLLKSLPISCFSVVLVKEFRQRSRDPPLPTLVLWCENHARKMRTFFTRRLEPKTRSSYHIKCSNAK